MTVFSFFSLVVELDGESEDAIEVLSSCGWDADCYSSDLFLASSASIRISPDHRAPLTEDYAGVCLVAIFIPKDYLAKSLAEAGHDGDKGSDSRTIEDSSIEWIDPKRRGIFTNCMASRTHMFLSNSVVRGVIRQNGLDKAAADILLVEAPSVRWLADMISAIDGEGMIAGNDQVIKTLPLSQVSFVGKNSGVGAHNVASLSTRVEIPSCPVCLHRIDPVRVGLPKPKNHHLCSKFCGVKSQIGSPPTECNKQRFLAPWPLPSFCVACHVIDDHWKNASRTVARTRVAESRGEGGEGTAQNALRRRGEQAQLFCNRCGMQETLWVCLSCGFVGCGRYSNVHAEEHYKESGHNYSLELVTLRIWDYANGEFAQRGDLLECPLVRRTLGDVAVGRIGTQSAFARGNDYKQEEDGEFEPKNYQIPSFYALSSDETSPKKANMIGEEYEALLQSALEDQAQHYEGEITRLRAALTAEQVDERAVTEEEMKEIDALNADIANCRAEIDAFGRQLVDAQAQEAGYRASSQRLLREQAVTNELLEKIREEAARENEQGKMQVDELEQQIADLTANLRMRHQFSKDEELSNAQIFGTTSHKKQSKRGKKSRRFWK